MAKRTVIERADQARALDHRDLVLGYLTLPRIRFEDRVAAAAAAGFAGIALDVRDWKRQRADGMTVADLGEVLDRHSQLLVEIEFLQRWSAGPGAADRARQEEQLAYELAAGVGARHLQLGGSLASPAGVAVEIAIDHLAEAFAGVCDRAAEHGLLVALEYLPEMTAVGSVGQALAIVERAGRPNGGICVDSWHHERGPDTLATLAAVDGSRIASVQLDDGPVPRREPDYVTDTSTNRLPPGEGQFDLVGLLTTLDGLGVRAPLSLEVISPSVSTSGPPDAVARRVADGMRRVLAQLP